MEIWMEFD